MSEQTVLSIIGPTGSGKTAWAGKLVDKWCQQGQSVSVISLDSRQVYRELTHISVAEWEWWQQQQKKYQTLLTVHNIADRSIWEEWSFGLLLAKSRQQLAQALAQERQVIAVGGTLVCHERLLVQSQDVTAVPPNDNIRFAAENMTVEQLQAWLQKIDSATWQQLNHSDRLNPRRLVRKIEIAIAGKTGQIPTSALLPRVRQRWLVPDYDRQQLEVKVKERVSERLRDKQVQTEVRQLLEVKSDLLADEKIVSRLPLGCTQMIRYLTDEWTIEQAEKDWQRQEWQYAKKQLTWVKKLVFDHHADLVDKREILAN